jgi:hypothetical protein
LDADAWAKGTTKAAHDCPDQRAITILIGSLTSWSMTWTTSQPRQPSGRNRSSGARLPLA